MGKTRERMRCLALISHNNMKPAMQARLLAAAPYPCTCIPPKHPSPYTLRIPLIPKATPARPALAAQEFVKTHRNVLSNFRLTGTASTMKMLRSVMPPNVVFGPTCASGPLGGDAQVHEGTNAAHTHTHICG